MDTKIPKALGHRLILKPYFDNEKTDWGFLLDVGETYQREKAATIVGEVVSIGSMCWKAYDGDNPEWAPWCKVGDVVYFAKYAGKFITIEEQDYLIVNDIDVQAMYKEGPDE